MTHMASLTWFAGHEVRLAWRDWTWLFAGGRRARNLTIALVLLVLTVGLHGLAYFVLKPHFASGFEISKATLLALAGTIVLAFTMMLSQALEMVTRAFYTRDDLDLILSSPAPAGHMFAVRLLLLAVSNAMMSGLFMAPFINVAIAFDGWHWLAGYGVVLALGMISTAGATLIVLWLFAMIGARRTRLVAQITAAVVSASFLIGVQAVAIVGFGSLSRWTVFSSEWLQSQLPATSAAIWLPCLAIMGDPGALALVVVTAVMLLGLAMYYGSRRFSSHVLAAASIGDSRTQNRSQKHHFRVRSISLSLMVKEWRLLGRDPWLISQTLMQVFYLIPPGLMLWITYGEDNPLAAIIAPVVVMAISQLAGGLAWLAISGEDAPELINTAPIPARTRILSKIGAVLLLVQAIALPFIIAMGVLSLGGAVATAIGVLLGASCAIAIQMMFHIPTKRSMFRRRQVASKASTFCEAFASILCAATAGTLAAAQFGLTAIPLIFLGIVMAVAWLLRPASDG